MEFDKSRVYTALNADELKVGDKVYVADSLSDLKRLVEMNMSNCERKLKAIRKDYEINRFVVENPDFNEYAYNLAYLVERAEEKKFRPYKDTDEMIADYKKRFSVDCAEYEFPLIWIKSKEIGGEKNLIIDAFESAIGISDEYVPFKSLFNSYTYLDGSPCGVEE